MDDYSINHSPDRSDLKHLGGRRYEMPRYIAIERTKRNGGSHGSALLVLSDAASIPNGRRSDNHAELRVWRSTLAPNVLTDRVLLTRWIVSTAAKGAITRDALLASAPARRLRKLAQKANRLSRQLRDITDTVGDI